jgi:hypothetical protein
LRGGEREGIGDREEGERGGRGESGRGRREREDTNHWTLVITAFADHLKIQ